MHRECGPPFRHPYFRLDESAWLIFADLFALTLLMIRTPLVTARRRSTVVCLLFICYLFVAFYLFVTIL
jgi:hypothetical protein